MKKSEISKCVVPINKKASRVIFDFSQDSSQTESSPRSSCPRDPTELRIFFYKLLCNKAPDKMKKKRKYSAITTGRGIKNSRSQTINPFFENLGDNFT